MFDLLKKKIASFTEKITSSAEKTPAPEETPAQERAPAREDAQAPKELPEVAREKPEEIDIAGEKGLAEEKAKKIRVDDRRELKAGVGLAKKAAALVTGKIRLNGKEIENYLEEFELALLESDVGQETAQEIIGLLGKELEGKAFPKKGLEEELKKEVKGVLAKVMEATPINFLEKTGSKKPFVILVLGPNGAGKTTTIAKMTKLLQDNGKKVVWAASDTFRAASIEQLAEHAEKLGVRMVRHDYGADPAAVAFDAVKAAEAGGIDVVMIDSAGRQETNHNLMEELKKIGRVAKPDLKIYVGEAYTGQGLLNQAKEFDKELGLDCFVLSKIDTDAKGGTAISLLHVLKKPIIFVGTGQRYTDLVAFKPEYVLERVIG